MLKFEVRLSVDPKLWGKWYTETVLTKKHPKFNAAFLALNGLVHDPKPYRVRTKIAQRASFRGKGPLRLPIKGKEKRLRSHKTSTLSGLRRWEKLGKRVVK